jgi:hypothetical protein
LPPNEEDLPYIRKSKLQMKIQLFWEARARSLSALDTIMDSGENLGCSLGHC